MTTEKLQSSIYPKKQMSYTAWCKKFKVGSRVQKYNTKKYYEEGEYNYEKFIKMIKNYGTNQKQRSSIWSESLDRLRSLLASN
jgi:predicted RecB family nuclease